MTWQELTTLDITGKNIFITGSPASGKTTLTNKLHLGRKGHFLIDTDAFIALGFEQAMYAALDEYAMYTSKGHFCIVSGVQTFRMLRKMVERKDALPDIVICLLVGWNRVEETYLRERPGKNMEKVKQMWASTKDLDYQLSELLPSSTSIVAFKNDY